MNQSLQTAFARVYQTTEAFTPARTKALAQVRWILGTAEGDYVADLQPRYSTVALTDNPTKAMIFDGRDNEVIKLKYYQAVTGKDLMVMPI